MLWLFQIIFFEKFYTKYKIRNIKESVSSITETYENSSSAVVLSDKLDKIASQNDICIEIVDCFGHPVVYTKEYSVNCLIHDNQNSIYIYLREIIDNGNDFILRRVPHVNYEILFFGCPLGCKEKPNGYLFINTAIVPVRSTVSIIKRQLIVITIVLIIFAFFMSLLLSISVAKPIEMLTKSAKKLANGDFKTKFDVNGYLEVKQLADTLTYAEHELSRVDTMQRDLIANVSHDLKTPLTMLKAYAEMIRDISGDTPIKRNEHLKIIIDETDRLTLMVNDILDLSKLESGSQKLTPSEFEISSKLENIISRFKCISEQMGYNIHFQADDERIVRCDVIKIEQVIYNLINNAINYTGDDKQVFIRQINKPEGIIIEIQDTGEGIDKNKIKMIFDKYYRSENHKREIFGTGLGLSIVKAILKLHGYDYGIYSTFEKGSIFWFKISSSDVIINKM